MELRHYLSIIMQRKWIIIVTLFVTLVITIAGTFLITPVYSASTVIRIATAAGGSVDYYDYMYTDRLMNTYLQSVTSNPTLDQLKQLLNIQKPPQIKAEIIPNTELIRITVDATDPIFAADVANDLSNILISQSETLYSGGTKSPVEILNEQLNQLSGELATARSNYDTLLMNSPGDTEQITALNQSISLKEQMYASVLNQYDQARVREALRANMVSVFEPAEVPKVPSKPNKLLNISLGLIVGLIGGLGLAFLFENLDTTLYTSNQIKAVTQLPIWGEIPLIRKNRKSLSLKNEAFRRLRTNLLGINQDGYTKVLMLTSAELGEGKSTVLVNLAFSLVQSGHTVILIDCDLRKPTLHKYFNLPNVIGLSSWLEQKKPLEDVIQPFTKSSIKVITSGHLPSDPTQLLGGQNMAILIDKLRGAFDFVLVDTPALLSVTDALVLTQYVDGVMLVVNRSRAHRDSVLDACKQLDGIKAKTIAVVVNRAEQNKKYGYYATNQDSEEKIDGNAKKKIQ